MNVRSKSSVVGTSPDHPTESPASNVDPNVTSVSNPTDRVPHPTHHLEKIKLGEDSIQMLVTADNQLYKAIGIDVERKGVQCVGKWGDESIVEMARAIQSRASGGGQGASSSTTPVFRGPGHTL